MKKLTIFALFVFCFRPITGSFAQQTVPEIRFDSVPDYPKLPPGVNLVLPLGSCLNSVRKASSCAKSARDHMPGLKPTRCESTRMTTYGLSTRVLTWSSSSIRPGVS
jgi:hypothetical protein